MRRLPVVFVLLAFIGCGAPHARLSFPEHRIEASAQPQWFDVDADGRNDFAMTFDDRGRVDGLFYDDDQDGTIDHRHRLADYDDQSVPHAIILLDSVPFHCVADRYAAGQFRWFEPPVKIIPPFPSLTEVCYNELLHGPPLPGFIDQYYDRRARKRHDGLFARAVAGKRYPWEQALHYRSKFYEEGLAYLDPRPWYQAELERARKALESSDDHATIVYLTSASGMACKYGREGIDEVLDGAARLCVQLLHKRRGAIKISLMADHGHNLVSSRNIRVNDVLRKAGFRPADRLDSADDVVVEMNGMVTYAAVRTSQPRRVAPALLKHEGIEMAMYRENDRVIVQDATGEASIDCRGERLRYQVISSDVLKYAHLLADLSKDPDGFVSRDEWFGATIDHEYPDAPPRLWDAFHRLVDDPPDVLFTTRDGYTAGLPSLEKYKMKSTHGSLDQLNSATFLLTMTARAKRPMRSADVMRVIEPSYAPPGRSGR